MWSAVENIGRARIAERTILLQARQEIDHEYHHFGPHEEA